jgi:NAD(P)-dependent dehydrogenase (short-subunit alcohol dehydrogenase family)
MSRRADLVRVTRRAGGGAAGLARRQIPREATRLVRRAIGTASLSQALKDKTIVLAGDQTAVADSIASRLTGAGAKVSHAHEASDVTERPDAIITIADARVRERTGDDFADAEEAIRHAYFRPVELLIALLPGMRARGSGQVINVFVADNQHHSSREPAIVGARAALESWARCVAPEVLGEGIEFTTVRVRDHERAAGAVVRALVHRPKTVVNRRT